MSKVIFSVLNQQYQNKSINKEIILSIKFVLENETISYILSNGNKDIPSKSTKSECLASYL